MVTRTDFGQRLKQARQHAKLTQKQLAPLSGVTQGTLSELETKAYGSANTVQLAAACGVNAHWLATGEGEMLSGDAPPVSPPELTVADALDVLQHRLHGLPPHAWAEVADTLRLWAGSGGKKYRGAVQEALEPEVLNSDGILRAPVHGSTKEIRSAAEALADKRTSSRKPIRKAA
jgi:transcriptional regulator with XRE-family HTH domain